MKRIFPYLIFIAALFISITGSFFSIYGLGKLFGGHQFGATVIAFAFEFGNVITAASLKYFWKFLPRTLKIPLIVIVIILTLITTMGLYGYLSDGYQKTAMKDEIVSKKSNLVKLKRDNFQLRVSDYKKELESVNNSITELTKGLNTNSQTQQVDKRTGQVITNVIVGSKKSIDNQLQISNIRKTTIDSIITNFQDSIQRLELNMIELEANNENASELGPLKYLESLTGFPMNKIVNILILLIVIVFQPLAILLLLLSMFAFKNNHYLSRTNGKNSKIIKFDFISNLKKSLDSLKHKLIRKKPNPPQTPIPEVKPKEKRKYVRKVKVDPEIQIVEEPVISEEIVEEIKKTPRRRKIVDTNLTAGLAEHIAKSLPNNKKKV